MPTHTRAQALTDEEVSERLREGPLLYAAPWGGGLRIVVPHPHKRGPQRRGELSVDWRALPRASFLLSEDGGPGRAVGSLAEALGLMGAFDAPRKVLTAVKVLTALQSKARRSTSTRKARSGSESEESEDEELEEAARAVIGEAIVRTALLRRGRKERAARRAAQEAAQEAAKAAAQEAPAAAAGLPKAAAVRDCTPEPAAECRPPPARVHHGTKRLALMSGDDASAAAGSSWKRFVGAFGRHQSALLQSDAAAAQHAMATALHALEALEVLVTCSLGAGAARRTLRALGFFEFCCQCMAAAEGIHLAIYPPRSSAALLLEAPGGSGMSIGAAQQGSSVCASPPPPPRAAPVPPLSLAPGVLKTGEPRAPQPAPPASPGGGGDARQPRHSRFRDLNAEVEAAEVGPANAAATAAPHAGGAASVPRLALPGRAAPPAPPITPGRSPFPLTQHTPLLAPLLRLLLHALLSSDGRTVEAACAADGAATGGPPGCAALALSLLQQHLRSLPGEALLPALTACCASAPAALQLLRLCAPRLFTHAVYAPTARLGRGAFAVVYEAQVARLGPDAPRRVALKLQDAPLFARAQALSPASLRAACETALQEACGVRDAFAEVGAMVALEHGAPGWASLLLDFGAVQDGYALVMRPYACSLRTWRLSHGAAAPSASRLYAAVYAQALDACTACAAAGCVHLDIKADNFLLEARPGGGEAQAQDFWAPTGCGGPQAAQPLPFRLRLSDWGSSRRFADGGAQGTQRHCGSECVKAPEMLRAGAFAAGAGAHAAAPHPDQGCGAPADVWAAGLLAFETFTGAPLYGQEAEREWVRFFVRLTSPGADLLPPEALATLRSIHPAMEPFLRAVLKRPPSSRPSMAALASRWNKLLKGTLTQELPPYAPPVATAPPPADRRSAAAAAAEQPGLALHCRPVEVAPRLWLAPEGARGGEGEDGFAHTLRCSWGGATCAFTQLGLPRLPHAGATRAIDAALRVLLAALAETEGRVLLCCAPDAALLGGTLAAAWLVTSAQPPPHGLLGALRCVACLAPGAAPDAAAREVLADWAEERAAKANAANA